MKVQIWMGSAQGERLTLLENVVRFHYVKAINGAGYFTLALPAHKSVDDLLTVDNFIQFWPEINGRPLFDFIGFLRYWGWHGDDRGLIMTELGGPDQNDLLRRRIVAYKAGTSQTELSGSTLVDDGMKDIFYENFLAGATGARNIASLGITVDADQGAGPNLDRSFAWRRVVDILRDLNEASRAAGTEVFFEVVVASLDEKGHPSLEFRTYTGQPGSDKTSGSAQPVIVGLEYGNLEIPQLIYDWRNTENYVYAGGQGEESDRNVQEVSNSDQIAMSPYNRCEGFAQANNESTNEGVQGAGYARLGKYAPIARFTGYILGTEQTPYGSWGLGDRVTVVFRDHVVDAVIRRVEIMGRADTPTVARGYIEEYL